MTATKRPARRGAIGVGNTRLPLGPAFAVMLVLLYLPIVLLAVFSFNANTSLSFPLKGLTLDWYGRVFDDPALLGAARNSLVVATVAATAATALGFAVSLAVLRFRFAGRRLLLALAVAPLVVPFVVLGVALFLLFNILGVPRSLLTVALGHSVVALPYVTLILLSRIVGLDPALEDAAMDLGASYPTTLGRVILPLVGPTLLSAWLAAFIVSFDEVALANFLAGGDPTFPVFLYGQLRFAGRLPVLIAMAVVLMTGTIILTLIANRLRTRNQ
ncbi:MAG: ABC transporter permease [Chloroflexota bacterium]